MRSLVDNVAIGTIYPFLATTTAVVGTSPSVDTKGYTTGALRVGIPATAAISMNAAQVGTLVVVLQESSDNVTFATATSVDGNTIGSTLTATTTAVLANYRIEGLGTNRLRYLRVKLTPTMSSASTAQQFTATAVIELGRGYNRPSSTSTSNT